MIIKVEDYLADGEFSLLDRHLSLLDSELIKINAAIKETADPESDGLCDTGEYFIGHGFVAIQRYLTATHAGLEINRSRALSIPPFVNGSMLTFAEALNAGANYWKHCEEWFEILSKSENAKLKDNALKTIAKLEMATPVEEYTCSNLLAILANGREVKLISLLPEIAEWRNNLEHELTTLLSEGTTNVDGAEPD